MKRYLGAVGLAAMLSGQALAGGLQPLQMVRSLQRVQDRIADGDHAALPMQRKLLGIIDERLRAARPEEFDDPRNFHALLVYGASGGNPATLDMAVSRLALEGTERTLGDGVVRYARGDFSGAREILRDVEPLGVNGELSAPLALVIGSLLVQENPSGALRLFDEARLLSPGTLIEEAALRRTIAVSATLHDLDRFALAASQYVRRFLHSPYASQFAEAFVSAIITLHEEVDLELIEEVAAEMNAEQAHVIYLRIARQSAIEGHERLLAFASRNAEKYVAGEPEESDPRAVLYANVASVTSQNAGDVLETLKGIDVRRLSANDRRLLKAATEIAERVVARPVSLETMAQEEPPPADAGNTAFVAETLERLQAIDALLQEETR
ncbi:chemotaxis protein [Chelativorans xinjiangense]|uniref:chemotaxis protein n=1 Tax=Chelativorans xinjiangense TaxID=2681485 RepID=UPI00135B407C|nr:chemotaxis protein [Chelativorans xinjiangense]